MRKEFITKLFDEHNSSISFPKPTKIYTWCNQLLSLLFPVLSEKCAHTVDDLETLLLKSQEDFIEILKMMEDDFNISAVDIAGEFYNQLPVIYERIKNDAESIEKGDPAATGVTEVILTYPGFYAIAFYRFANALFLMNLPLVPRIITEYASTKTGIEIHPGATIGKNLCIDHGSGVVIGGTCIIGDNVKIYQGVTLGALSVSKDMADSKRHPTIEDNVVIYSGATILGGETIVGANSIIGGNVWLTKSVPENSVVYFNAQVNVKNQQTKEQITI